MGGDTAGDGAPASLGLGASGGVVGGRGAGAPGSGAGTLALGVGTGTGALADGDAAGLGVLGAQLLTIPSTIDKMMCSWLAVSLKVPRIFAPSALKLTS